ncbi:LuxR C-terminal-related transcriptional regulator [Streptomyces sp. NBC_00233]|nr:LuxR C-terminal-related transcriptional regulator [Streptomyces sp. NBC_00233]
MSDPVEGFAAVAGALSKPGEHRMVVLVDDVHLLDATSAVLLRQLLDAGVIFLIGTVRSGEEKSTAVEALGHGNAVQRVDLSELERTQVESLLQQSLGLSVGLRTSSELFLASGGNVLYLRELVLGALASGELVNDGEVWELTAKRLRGTPRLHELIGHRLSAASSDGRLALEYLAVCEPMSLADLAGMGAEENVLVDLERAGLIRTLSEGKRTRVSLAHPLYGEVLRAELPLIRRRALVLRRAEQIAARGARRRDDALHIASSRLAATGSADPSLLIQAATLSRHAHDYPQVVALISAIEEDKQTPATRLLLGEALFEVGDSEQAEAVLAAADARAIGERQKLAVTIARVMSLFWISGRTEEALAVNSAARAHVSSPEAQRILLINEAAMRTISGEPGRGLTLLADLSEDLEQEPNANIWLRGAMIKGTGLALRGRTDEAVALTKRSYTTHVMIARQEGKIRVPHPATQLIISVIALGEAGRLPEARWTGERGLADLESVHAPLAHIWMTFWLARAEWQAGHPGTARHLYAEAAAQSRIHHNKRPLRPALAGLAATAAVLGDTVAAETALRELEAHPDTGMIAGEEELGKAWLLAARGELTKARTVLLKAAAVARSSGHVTSEALILTDVARMDGAREVTDRLNELAQQTDGAFAVARAHFAAALATGDAERLLQCSIECERLGADLLAAEAASTAAAVWRQRGESRRATAASHRAATAKARCEGALTPLLTAAEVAAPLTIREHEIALLAASGVPSKGIAARLVLSVRTVDNHLQRIYSKLGITNRGQLSDLMKPTAQGGSGGPTK